MATACDSLDVGVLAFLLQIAAMTLPLVPLLVGLFVPFHMVRQRRVHGVLAIDNRHGLVVVLAAVVAVGLVPLRLQLPRIVAAVGIEIVIIFKK